MDAKEAVEVLKIQDLQRENTQLGQRLQIQASLIDDLRKKRNGNISEILDLKKWASRRAAELRFQDDRAADRDNEIKELKGNLKIQASVNQALRVCNGMLRI